MGSALLAASNRQLSQSLHDNMLSHVLFSPVSFFDVTPRGRIMNRFSVDLDAIDNRMYLSTKQCIQNSLHTIARFAVVGTQAPAVVLVGVLVTVALLFAMKVAVRASHAARMAESVRTSRLLQHVTETLESLSSIRAYGMVERFCGHFFRLADASMRAFSAFALCYRFIRLSSALAGLAVVTAALFFAVLLPACAGKTVEASSIGLALSTALSVCTHVLQCRSHVERANFPTPKVSDPILPNSYAPSRKDYRKPSRPYSDRGASPVPVAERVCQVPSTNGPTYACRLCSFVTGRHSVMKHHHLLHTGERPFECRCCPASFTTKAALVRHTRTHTGEKPFRCRHCGKAFVESGHVLVHERTHTGERPFRCGACAMAFTQKAHLADHMRLHTGERPFRCPLCTVAYKKRAQLTLHLKTTHAGDRSNAV
ncbi:hypothetical protein ISCGN_024492 [Ixodes scapularis]